MTGCPARARRRRPSLSCGPLHALGHLEVVRCLSQRFIERISGGADQRADTDLFETLGERTLVKCDPTSESVTRSTSRRPARERRASPERPGPCRCACSTRNATQRSGDLARRWWNTQRPSPTVSAHGCRGRTGAPCRLSIGGFLRPALRTGRATCHRIRLSMCSRRWCGRGGRLACPW